MTTLKPYTCGELGHKMVRIGEHTYECERCGKRIAD